MKKLLVLGIVLIAVPAYSMELPGPGVENNQTNIEVVQPLEQSYKDNDIGENLSAIDPGVAVDLLGALAKDLVPENSKYIEITNMLMASELEAAANAIENAENPVVNTNFSFDNEGNLVINLKAVDRVKGLRTYSTKLIADLGITIQLSDKLKTKIANLLDQNSITSGEYTKGTGIGEQIALVLTQNLDQLKVLWVSNRLKWKKIELIGH